MKKILSLILVAVLALSCMVACSGGEDPSAKSSDDIMTYAEYMAAEMDTEVVVEAYVQAHQSWWDNKITIYAQDGDGGYLFYNTACTEELADQLTPGTKIRVTGYKGEYAGEIEIMDGTIEIIDGNWVAPITDISDKLASDNIDDYMNRKVAINGFEVVAYNDAGDAFAYGNGESGDIYFNISDGENTYGMCIEEYLTGPDSDVYKAAEALEVGDVVNLEGFLYWWNGPNPHITSITVVD